MNISKHNTNQLWN